MAIVTLPEQVKGLAVVLSVSGGKDSTAASLALAEAGIEHRRVFADTGWEAPETYDHLDALRRHLGPIDVVKLDGGMAGEVLRARRFPARTQRWCTRLLKLQPLRAYHEAIGGETVNATGVRAGESQARARLVEVEEDDDWGGWVWRPLLRWDVADVLAIHHRHGVPIHPLYLKGHDRVGCWPGIYAGRQDLRLLPEDQIDRIEALEQEVNTARGPDRSPAHLFELPIRDQIAWARADRGGRQLRLYPDPPAGGCFKWGLCEAPGEAT